MTSYPLEKKNDNQSRRVYRSDSAIRSVHKWFRGRTARKKTRKLPKRVCFSPLELRRRSNGIV